MADLPPASVPDGRPGPVESIFEFVSRLNIVLLQAFIHVLIFVLGLMIVNYVLKCFYLASGLTRMSIGDRGIPKERDAI